MLFGNIVLFAGCMYRYALQDKFELYKKLLQKHLNIIVLPEEFCCGRPVMNLGYLGDLKELVKKNLELFKKYNVKELICPCPACYKTFKEEYPKLLGDKWKIRVKHVSEVLLELAKKGKIKKKEINNVIYHVNCHLRDEKFVQELLKVLGIQYKELNGCCGAGGGFRANYPEIAYEIGSNLTKDIEGTILTACPMCYYHLDQCVCKCKAKVLELIDIIQ